jgi:hypothetical protein
MPHFAKLDKNNVVVQVITAGQEYDSNGEELYAQITGDVWKKTSYNTRANVHYGPDGTPDGGIPFRKNYAGIGMIYQEDIDAFIHPQPFPSWYLDINAQWQPPISYPNDGNLYTWDEATQSWVQVNV